MDRDILVLVVVSVDYKEVILQVREINTMEHLIQPRIPPGMSAQKDEPAATLIAVMLRGTPTVA